MSENFRTAARALQPFITDTYTLLLAADAVVSLLPDQSPTARREYPHAVLVAAALGSDEVMTEVYAGKKINAIKALRTFTNSGLKAAKEAVEDEKVMMHFDRDRHAREFEHWLTDTEPPF